jgi:type III secretion system chaperone SycN
MSWVDDALREFGQSMGLPNLAFSERGVVRLSIGRMGRLGLERQSSEVLIFLLRTIPVGNGKLLRKALTLCHYSEGHPFVVQTGLKGDDQLIFLLRIPEREFTVQAIEQSIELLDRLHASIA